MPPENSGSSISENVSSLRPNDDTEASCDAREILEASLNFENSHVPDPQPLVDRRSSSTSLYPPLESLEDAEHDTAELEEAWAAARPRGHPSSRLENNNNNYYPAAAGRGPQHLQFSHHQSLHPHYPPHRPRSLQMLRHRHRGPSPFPHGPPFHNHNRNSASDDDELIALKLAAYEGRDIENSVARMPNQQSAEATIVDFDLHPSEISVDSIQADLIGQDYGSFFHNDSGLYSSSSQTQPPPTTTTTLDASQYLDSVQSVIATSADATEATVIESGPIHKWSPSATEATVLEDFHNEIVDLDRKPPAVDYSQQHWSNERLLDLEASARASETGVAAEATVLEENPSNLSLDAVAEFDHFHYNAGIENSVEAESQSPNELIDSSIDIDRDTTEATVIDSAPMEIAGNATPKEEAHVLNDNVNATINHSNLKPPPGEHVEWRRSGADPGTFSMTDGEAQVVGISQDIHHPSEFLDDATRAELIGTDSNCHSISPQFEDAGIVEENTNHVEEAHVLQETGAHTSISPGLKVPPSERLLQWRSSESSQVSHALNEDEREAEVVGISEAAHPSELEDSTRAELIGTDPNHAIAFQSDESEDADILIDEGPRAFEETRTGQPRAAQATIITEGEYTHLDRQGALAGQVSQLPETFPPREAVRPVAVLPENHDSTSSSLSYDIDRSSKAIDPVEDSLTALNSVPQSDRINAPSLGGIDRSVQSMAPPVQVASNNQTENETLADFRSSNDESLTENIASSASNSQNYSLRNVMKTLFGNNKNDVLPGDALTMLPRTLLPSSVTYSEATSSWVTTVNTNQKALEANDVEESSKALRAFSVPSRKQAICLARAWSPPKMHHFESNWNCFICKNQFAVFKRACHCRNCGVVVCSSCCCIWPSSMIPNTYNIKQESFVNVCKTCDWLCSAFRLALLNGDRDKAVALHASGNINLTSPFANVKGELFYPVHCAVLGGNLHLLQFLVDDHCCPLRSIRISGTSNRKQDLSGGSYTPILTSKGRSLLSIALQNRSIDIVRYLVVQKGMCLFQEKLSSEILSQNLDLVLRILPEEALGQQQYSSEDTYHRTLTRSDNQTNSDDVALDNDEGIQNITSTNAEACIICCDKRIDSVAIPCGHQVCCLECSTNLSRCPVCSIDASFMKVFRA